MKAPKGGHRRLPHFGKAVEKAKAEKEGTPGKRLSHICQVVLLNVGSMTKGRQEAWRLTIKPGGFKIEAGGSKIEAWRL